MAADKVEEYRGYLRRYDDFIGPAEFGSYTTYRGRLIKKLTYEEFAAKWREFQEVDQSYREILLRGDTLSDVLLHIIKERRDELLLEKTV